VSEVKTTLTSGDDVASNPDSFFYCHVVCCILVGDWVAVRMARKRSQCVYVARVDAVVDADNLVTVTFLKKHVDGSYRWPHKQYICDVDKSDVIKLSNPSEDVVSGTAATSKVKLSFNATEINAAREGFGLAMANVC
jgi:hypothetical protein